MKLTEDKTQGWKHAITCNDCGSAMEIVVDDILIGEFGGGWGDSGEHLPYVPCAACRAYVKLVKLPEWVQRRANENDIAKRRR